MKIKTLQWNIGGGRIRNVNSDPTKETDSLFSSYTEDGLDYIITKLKEWDADVITLQETHSDENIVQAKIIAEQLGLSFWVNDKYNDSHIENGQNLCQSIISKYPIEGHSFEFFENPLFEIVVEDGSSWISHNKGLTSAEITLPNNFIISIGTLHLVPFSKFKKEYSDSKVAEILKDVSEKILSKVKEPVLIQGDFNINDKSLKLYLPELFSVLNEVETINPTTPKGKKYDHILYKGLNFIKNETFDDVFTDHYPILSEFEL